MNKISAADESFEVEFFRLLLSINSLLRKLADQRVSGDGLTPTQMLFMKLLAESAEPQPISYLADSGFSNRSNASQMVDRLEGEGLVERVRHPRDRRSVLVQLTPFGAQRFYEGYARLQRLAQVLFAPLDGAERGQAIQVLRRVLALLQDFQPRAAVQDASTTHED